MSDLSLLSEEKRKLEFRAVRVAFDPAQRTANGSCRAATTVMLFVLGRGR